MNVITWHSVMDHLLLLSGLLSIPYMESYFMWKYYTCYSYSKPLSIYYKCLVGQICHDLSKLDIMAIKGSGTLLTDVF